MRQNNLLIKTLNWFAVFFWCYLIFYFSSQPDLKSNLPSFVDFLLRKAAHMAEYAILFILFFRAIRGHNLDLRKSIFLAIFFSVLYAVSDEYHQTFVTGRMGSVFDILIDGFGVIIGRRLLGK